MRKAKSESSIPKELSAEEKKKLLSLLNDPQLDSKGIQEILSHAEVLSLVDKEITEAGIQVLAEALKTNQTIREINLRNNDIGFKGAKALASALGENQVLMKINLGNNKIGSEGAKVIALALKKNKTLIDINLENNNIGFEGEKAIASALETNQGLIRINLESNDIFDKDGEEPLAKALEKNQTLRVVNLKGNWIDYTGVDALAKALRTNHTLTHIELSNNQRIDRTSESFQFVNHSLEQNRRYQHPNVSEIQQYIASIIEQVPLVLIIMILEYYLDEEKEKDSLDEKATSFSLSFINSDQMRIICHAFKQEKCRENTADNTWVISLSNQISLRTKLVLRDGLMQIFSKKKNMSQAVADVNFESKLVLKNFTKEQFENLADELDKLLVGKLLPKEEHNSWTSSIPSLLTGYLSLLSSSPARPEQQVTAEERNSWKSSISSLLTTGYTSLVGSPLPARPERLVTEEENSSTQIEGTPQWFLS